MFFTPNVSTQPKEVPKSTLSLKIKITQKLFQCRKDLPDDKPGLGFQYTELQEKWETLAKPPEKTDFLNFIAGIEGLIDRLIGENNMNNNAIIDILMTFKEEALVLGIPYFGATLTNDYSDFLNNKNLQLTA